MRITFDTAQDANIQGKGGAQKAYASPKDAEKKAQREQAAGAYSVEIGARGRRAQTGAYKKGDMTAEDISMQAGQMDMDAQKMYMAVMSNSMSAEDFHKMLEDGCNVSDVDIETAVTILDRIKVAVAKGGGEVAGFTDSLSAETLEAILGSAAYAAAFEGGLEDGAAAYMVEKQMPPTAENLYKAKYSAGACRSKEAGDVPERESAEGKAFWEQIDRVISAAGLPEDGQGREDAVFLLQHDVPVTEENLLLYQKIKPFMKGADGISKEELKRRIAAQAYEGKPAFQADLSKERSIYEEAVVLFEAVRGLTPEAVERALQELPEGRGFALKDILGSAGKAENAEEQAAKSDGEKTQTAETGRAGEKQGAEIGQSSKAAQAAEADKAGEKAQAAEADKAGEKAQAAEADKAGEKAQAAEADKAGESGEARANQGSEAGTEAEHTAKGRTFLTARRQLEEVRLRMTVEANVKLLRSGFQIDIAPMEQLIEKLRAAEEAFAEQGIPQMTEVSEKIEAMRTMPMAALGFVVSREIPFTVEALHAKGGELAGEPWQADAEHAKREAAGRRYETMQTQVRADLGDSIRRAFRNVDDILADMNREPSEENRRAVRMLGYNRLELSEENLARALEVDGQVQRLFRDLKPGKVLQMIRDGVDVLRTDIGELDAYLAAQGEGFMEESEDFARFLHKLDKNGGMSPEERESYIGIYRLVRQVEKSDGRAEGYLLGSGAQLTMENLLSAVRSAKKGAVDYRIDENFSGVDALRRGKDIVEQISALPYENTAAYEEVVQTLEGLAQETRQGQKARAAQRGAADFLKDVREPVTVANLVEASSVLQEDAGIYNRLEEYAKETDREEMLSREQSRFERYVAGLQDAVADEASLREGMEAFAEQAEEILRQAETREGVRELDIRELQRLCRGVRFRTAISREARYQIPIKMDSGYTVMNLTVRRGTGSAQAEISVETEQYGRLEAVFAETAASGGEGPSEEEGMDGGKITVSGTLFAETEEGQELLRGMADKVWDGLKDAGIPAKEIAVLRGKRVRRSGAGGAEAGDKAAKTGQSEISTGELYKIAKIFLETVRNE